MNIIKAILAIWFLGAATAMTASPSVAAQLWNFDTDKVDEAPLGFSFGRTGSGAQGRWVVRAEKGAPSGGNVLAQMDADDTDDRFPIAVVATPVLSDLRLSVKCKPVSGKVDQACGLVFRYVDENNYYITRANPLENNIRFYYVKDGKRRQLASYSGQVTSGAWHELSATATGNHFEISWDGKKVLDADDKTFSAKGLVGVWTKADSVTYFDDLTVAPFP